MITIHICTVDDFAPWFGDPSAGSAFLRALEAEQEEERRAWEEEQDRAHVCANCSDTGWKLCPGHEIDPDSHEEGACPWGCAGAEVPCCERGNGEEPRKISDDEDGDASALDALDQA